MKYDIYSTREDWEKLYEVVKYKLGVADVKRYKKMQSYDSAITYLASESNDYRSVKEIWAEMQPQKEVDQIS